MNLLPSKRLAFYLGKMFAVRFLAFLFGLVLILQALDLLNESDDILAGSQGGYGAILKYLSLRTPQLLSQFLPFAALLGALLSFASLNQNSEVVIMKAAGLSAHQILAPVILVGLLAAGCHFALNEAYVARASAELKRWNDNDYKTLPANAVNQREVWVIDGTNLIHAKTVRTAGKEVVMDQVTIYRRPEGKSIEERTDAARAVFRDGAWTLQDVAHFNAGDYKKRLVSEEAWTTSIPVSRFLAVAIDAEATDYWRLGRVIRDLKASGHPVETLEAVWLHKISQPLSTALMPLLAAIAAFGIARSGKLFGRIVLGMALGFAFFVADNFMMAMGRFGAAPPLLAAWAPFLLFFCMGQAVIFRTEE